MQSLLSPRRSIRRSIGPHLTRRRFSHRGRNGRRSWLLNRRACAHWSGIQTARAGHYIHRHLHRGPRRSAFRLRHRSRRLRLCAHRGPVPEVPASGRVEIGDDVEIGANPASTAPPSVSPPSATDEARQHGPHRPQLPDRQACSHRRPDRPLGRSGRRGLRSHRRTGRHRRKARIETRAVLGSGCGVLTSKIVRSGQAVWGTPARPLKEYLQQLANMSKIAELRAEVAELKKRLG